MDKILRKPRKGDGIPRMRMASADDMPLEEVPTTGPIFGLCELWIHEEADGPGMVPILAAVHRAAQEVTRKTGRWPFCLAMAPLLFARLQKEVLQDGEIQEKWPTTLEEVKGPDDTLRWHLMGIPVLELEGYPPEFCRVLGAVPERLVHCDVEEAADVVLAIIRAVPVRGEEGPFS